MMLKLTSFSFFFLITLSIFQIRKVECGSIQTRGPTLEIFYETLNNVARDFFLEEFQLVANAGLLENVDLYLYPYGNTVKVSYGKYVCPYGELQCEGNRIHACLHSEGLLNPHRNMNASASFLTCFYKNQNQFKNLGILTQSCLPTNDLQTQGQLEHCINGDDQNVFQVYEYETSFVANQIKLNGLLVLAMKQSVSKNNFVAKICSDLGKTDGICASASQPDKLQLGFYYEADNLESGTYLIQQLLPNYYALEDFVQLELIPYGSTQLIEGSTVYNCSRGEMQCLSNKFQALVVERYMNNPKNGGDLIPGASRVLNFLQCLFKRTNSLQSLRTCSNQNLDSLDTYESIIESILTNSNEVRAVMDKMQNKTQGFVPNGSLSQIPLVTVNGVVSEAAKKDLVRLVCSRYSVDSGPLRPAICSTGGTDKPIKEGKVLIEYDRDAETVELVPGTAVAHV